MSVVFNKFRESQSQQDSLLNRPTDALSTPVRQTDSTEPALNLQHDGITLAANIMSAVRRLPAVDRVVVEKYHVKLRQSHLAGLESESHLHPILVDFMVSLLQERECLQVDRKLDRYARFCSLVRVSMEGPTVVGQLKQGLEGVNFESHSKIYIPFYNTMSCVYYVVVIDCLKHCMTCFYSCVDGRDETRKVCAVVSDVLHTVCPDQLFAQHSVLILLCEACDSGVFALMCVLLDSFGIRVEYSGILKQSDMSLYRQCLRKAVTECMMYRACVRGRDCPRANGRNHCQIFPFLVSHSEE